MQNASEMAAVVRAPFSTAPTVRVRPACWAAIRATMLNLRTVDTFTIVVDFNSVRGYNDGGGGGVAKPGNRNPASK